MRWSWRASHTSCASATCLPRSASIRGREERWPTKKKRTKATAAPTCSERPVGEARAAWSGTKSAPLAPLVEPNPSDQPTDRPAIQNHNVLNKPLRRATEQQTNKGTRSSIASPFRLPVQDALHHNFADPVLQPCTMQLCTCTSHAACGILLDVFRKLDTVCTVFFITVCRRPDIITMTMLFLDDDGDTRHDISRHGTPRARN